MFQLQNSTYVFEITPPSQVCGHHAQGLQYQLVRALLHANSSGVVLHCAQVELLDSAGLVALVNAYRLAQKKNKRLVLSQVSPTVRMVLELTQLDRVLEMETLGDSLPNVA